MQALYFQPIEGSWRFVGGALWQRDGGGGKGKRLWQLAHRGLASHGAYVLPERTEITAPGKRRDNLVVIQYRERELDPGIRDARPPAATKGAATTTDRRPTTAATGAATTAGRATTPTRRPSLPRIRPRIRPAAPRRRRPRRHR